MKNTSARSDDYDDSESGERRFFAPDLVPGRIILPTTEAHHAAHVLRLKIGESVELFDGAGRHAQGVIDTLSRHEVAVTIERVDTAPLPSLPKIRLCTAAPKSNRWEWLLEKTVELGVSAIQSVSFVRSVADHRENQTHKLEKWRAKCVAAAKQSGSCFLPEILPPVDLPSLLKSIPQPALKILGSPAANALCLRETVPANFQDEIIILVGPEGGLTPQEETTCLENGFHAVKLGANILRVETAGLALIAGLLAVRDQNSPLSR